MIYKYVPSRHNAMVVLCLSHYVCVCVCVLLHVAFAWLWLLIICFMMLMAGANNRKTRATCVGSPNEFPTSPGIKRCKPNGTRPHSDSKAIAPEIVHITRASYVVAAVVWHACICTYACSGSFVQLHSTTYIHVYTQTRRRTWQPMDSQTSNRWWPKARDEHACYMLATATTKQQHYKFKQTTMNNNKKQVHNIC